MKLRRSKMYGVVLWSDSKASKAVIWCEDHGNLAFYTPSAASALEGAALDPGDLVEFDLDEDAEFRFAHNPQVVGRECFSDLGQALGEFDRSHESMGADSSEAAANTDKVVPFPAGRRRA